MTDTLASLAFPHYGDHQGFLDVLPRAEELFPGITASVVEALKNKSNPMLTIPWRWSWCLKCFNTPGMLEVCQKDREFWAKDGVQPVKLWLLILQQKVNEGLDEDYVASILRL